MRPLSSPAYAYPRQRCLEAGPSALNLRECLALVLGMGTSSRESRAVEISCQIIGRPGEGLSRTDEERAFFMAMESEGAGALTDIPGLGPAGRAKLLASFELGRRYAIFRTGQMRPEVSDSHDLGDISALERRALARVPDSLRLDSREWLGFIALHRSGELGDLCVVERGTRCHVNVDPAELFARILVLRPSGFILFHNHPSGETTPSRNDIELTSRVQQTAGTLGIRLLGHWIVAPLSSKRIPPGLYP